MTKFFIIAFATFVLFSAEQDFLVNTTGSPVRRAPAMNPIADQGTLKAGAFAEKLITMVVCHHNSPGLYGCTERKIINRIKQNPANSNPYSAKYDAHLITLASRWGFLDIVRAIAESDARSIRCQSNGGQLVEGAVFTCYGCYTPLDEAVAFEQKEVAKYLYKLDAPMRTVARHDLHRLIDRPSKKRKSCC
jgi:hypothetical protein